MADNRCLWVAQVDLHVYDWLSTYDRIFHLELIGIDFLVTICHLVELDIAEELLRCNLLVEVVVHLAASHFLPVVVFEDLILKQTLIFFIFLSTRYFAAAVRMRR